VGCLWRALSGHHVEICDAHAVGRYDPFGELNPLILSWLAEIRAKADSESAIFSPAEMHERFDYRGASGSK